jgi:hypothetical protein
METFSYKESCSYRQSSAGDSLLAGSAGDSLLAGSAGDNLLAFPFWPFDPPSSNRRVLSFLERTWKILFLRKIVRQLWRAARLSLPRDLFPCGKKTACCASKQAHCPARPLRLPEAGSSAVPCLVMKLGLGCRIGPAFAIV